MGRGKSYAKDAVLERYSGAFTSLRRAVWGAALEGGVLSSAATNHLIYFGIGYIFDDRENHPPHLLLRYSFKYFGINRRELKHITPEIQRIIGEAFEVSEVVSGSEGDISFYIKRCRI